MRVCARENGTLLLCCIVVGARAILRSWKKARWAQKRCTALRLTASCRRHCYHNFLKEIDGADRLHVHPTCVWHHSLTMLMGSHVLHNSYFFLLKM